MSATGYWKNAAMLTGSGLLLRLAGMGLRVWLAGALGPEGLGLYELVLTFYGLFITIATAGVSVAATRLLAEEFAHGPARAAGMLRCLLYTAAGLGALAAAGQYLLAAPAAALWLGDSRAAAAIRAAAPGLPFMAVAAVLRGFFLALRQAAPNAVSQLVEQAFRMGLIFVWLSRTGPDPAARCTAVMAAGAASEMLSTGLMGLFCLRARRQAFGGAKACAAPDAGRRLWDTLWPVQAGRCLASGLHTAENLLVPACLTAALAAQGGRTAALEQYGVLKGMALPLLFFPFGLLGTLASLLMPELTQAHVKQQTARVQRLLDQTLTLTMYAGLFAAACFFVWGRPLADALYGSAAAGRILQILSTVMPLMYLESMVDGAMKALGQQKAVFGFTAADSALRVAGVIALVPRFGLDGFLAVMLFSNAFTCLVNLQRLLRVTRLRPALLRWLVTPAATAACAVLLGRWVSLQLGWQGWAAILLGGGAACAVWLPLAWRTLPNQLLPLRRKTKPAEKIAAAP